MTPEVTVKPAQRLVNVNRPLTGMDIGALQSAYGLTPTDVMHALGVPDLTVFKHIRQKPRLEVETELLLRLYDLFPGFAPWIRVTPADGFQMLYGDVLKTLEGTPSYAPAHIDLRRRLALSLDRNAATTLRWLEEKKFSEQGAKRGILILFRKLASVPEPRKVFDAIVQQTLAARGVDIDAVAPLPDPRNPPMPRKKGRKPGSGKKAAQVTPASSPAPSPPAPVKTKKVSVPEPLSTAPKAKTRKPTVPKTQKSTTKSTKSKKPA